MIVQHNDIGVAVRLELLHHGLQRMQIFKIVDHNGDVIPRHCTLAVQNRLAAEGTIVRRRPALHPIVDYAFFNIAV